MRLLPTTYASRNLGRSPLRLLLSVLGSAMVVLLVLAAGGFVRGMTASLHSSADPRNIMIVGIGSEESLERSEIPGSTASLLAASVPGLRTAFGVTFASPEVHVQLPVLAGPATPPNRLILVRGVTPAALLVHTQTQITEGHWPQPGHDELLAGRLAHTRLGVAPSALAVGNTVQIEGRTWTITGRLAAPNSIMDSELWLPLTDLKELTKRTTDSCIVATLGDGPTAAELPDIQSFCRRRLDLEITSLSESAYYSKIAAFFGPIRAVAWITASLIALGGVFGGLNTMYAAFASRTRELGMLQCLGYRRAAIVISMMQESCLATAAGALLAAALALVFLDGLAVQFSMGAFGLSIDPTVLALGLSAGILLGLVGTIPPAIRCLRLPITESLKSF
jgi:putative ABC transport system permease protein